eukprot:SM000083S22732  [mRNA]  locus=s83:179443:182473:- [translate_table: standard]
MDVRQLVKRMDLENPKAVRAKAEELLRLCKLKFEAASFGVGEIAKTILCLELACSLLNISMTRQKGIKYSGLSEKAYLRSLNAMQNALGIRHVKISFDPVDVSPLQLGDLMFTASLRLGVQIKPLAIQFGCVRLVNAVTDTLAIYKQRFLAALPASRRASADFGRPIFAVATFYLTAKKHKLKVDRLKLLEVAGIAEQEFASVCTSMLDLCYDRLGINQERRAAEDVKHNRSLLDVTGKRDRKEESQLSGDDEWSSDGSIDSDEELEVPGVQSRSLSTRRQYQDWKSAVVSKSASTTTAYKQAAKARHLELQHTCYLSSSLNAFITSSQQHRDMQFNNVI